LFFSGKGLPGWGEDGIIPQNYYFTFSYKCCLSNHL
jgi:hypothetical protein